MSTIQGYFPISATRVKAMDCPFYFKQQYLIEKTEEEKDDATKSLNLLVGGTGHKVIELYDQHLFRERLNSDNDLFQKSFDDVWKDNLYIPESKYDELKDMLTSFAEVHIFDFERVLAQCALCGNFSVSHSECSDCGSDNIKGGEIEIALNWDLQKTQWMADDVWLRAKLDRVELFPEAKLCVITDYKTGYYIPSETELKKSLQPVIYPFVMWCLNKSIETFKVIFHYIRWNKKIEIQIQFGDWLHVTEQRLRNFTERITKRIADPQAEWPAIVGENCPICNYACPLIEKGIEPLKTLDKAIDIGMQIQAIKKKQDDLTRQLKAWTKVTDEKVDIGIGVYGWLPSETLRGFKADKLAQFCMEKGININLILSPDTKRIKALEEDDIKKEIMAMAKVSTSSKFKFEKSGIDKEEEDD